MEADNDDDDDDDDVFFFVLCLFVHLFFCVWVRLLVAYVCVCVDVYV